MTRSVPTRRSSDLGIYLHTGPFLSHIRTAVPAVAEGIALLYADHKVSAEEPYADFHIALQRPGSLRRWIRSEEHTSEFQSLMRSSSAVFCLQKTNKLHTISSLPNHKRKNTT